jgi:CDP-diglyceride synthetase
MNNFFKGIAILFTILTVALYIYTEYFFVKKDRLDPFLNRIYIVWLLMALTGTLIIYYTMMFVKHEIVKNIVITIVSIMFICVLIAVTRNIISPKFHLPFE